MDKAIFVNGGAGRVMCAIPALEKHVKENPGSIVVSEAWGELFLTSPILRDKAYMPNTKNLFEEHLKDKEILSPEPYRLNAYYNQKCNLIQAFDMLINDCDGIPDSLELKMDIPKAQQVMGFNFLEEVKKNMRKEKTIVFQPFGSGAKLEGRFIIDSSGRSFELRDILKIIDELKEEYAVILMSTFKIPTDQNLGIVYPENMDLLGWLGIINAADKFLGCDSVGQHMAHALGKPAVVAIGATYPENISYPSNDNFTIIDIGKEDRCYAPYRIVHEPSYDLNNENLMVLSDEHFNQIIESVKA